MNHLIGDVFGLTHLIASFLALVSGTLIICLKKGTINHKRIGYAYVVSMVVLLATSFLIYRLFNGWGIFHYTSILSLVTLLAGMIPIWTKKPTKNWKYLHFTFMYWSIMGLYAAFTAEILTRIPATPFFGMVGIATGAIMFAGGILFGMKKKKWIRDLVANKVE